MWTLSVMVCFVLLKPPEGWTGGVGFVSKEMIEEHLPRPAFDIKVCSHRNMILEISKCAGRVAYQNGWDWMKSSKFYY